MTIERTRERWIAAWPDVTGWALSLCVTWLAGWTTTDLVWSLWLSSLIVGFAMIVWSILEPALELSAIAWHHRATVEEALANTGRATVASGVVAVLAVGFVFLGFFTIHFGGFHYIHSQFLIASFPLDGHRHAADLATYVEVARRYWWALPSAFLAERSGFAQRTFMTSETSDVSANPAAIAARAAASTHLPASRLMTPYVKVMRMHAMIIAFGFLHASRLDGFWVYAAVYALYFFPWRLIRKPGRSSVVVGANAV